MSTPLSNTSDRSRARELSTLMSRPTATAASAPSASPQQLLRTVQDALEQLRRDAGALLGRSVGGGAVPLPAKSLGFEVTSAEKTDALSVASGAGGPGGLDNMLNEAASRIDKTGTSKRIGQPLDNGGGTNAHYWDGLIVRDYSGGPDCANGGPCTVVDGPRGAKLIRDGFYAQYLGSTNGVPNHIALGAPLETEHLEGVSSVQRFEGGMMVYNTQTGQLSVQHFDNRPSRNDLGGIVDDCYQKVLGRTADPQGRANWTSWAQGQRDAGRSDTQIRNSLAEIMHGTVEFQNRRPPIRTDFVGVQNGHFNLNGRELRHVGANVPQITFETDQQVLTELDNLSRAGVKNIRTFATNSAWGPADIANRLNWIANEAGKRGMKLTVALTHNYGQGCWAAMAFGGKMFPMGDEEFVNFPGQDGLQLYNPDFYRGGYTKHYLPNVREIVSRLKDNPNIFAWEMTNELADPAGDGQVNLSFFRDVAATIKSIDPDHLVTTGVINSSFLRMNDAQRRALFSDKNIDYIQAHLYNNGAADAGSRAQYDADKQLARELGKPFIADEVGFDITPDPSDVDSVRAMRQFFDAEYNSGVDGIMPWAVTYDGSTGSGDGRWGPAGQGQYQDYLNLFHDWSEELKRRGQSV